MNRFTKISLIVAILSALLGGTAYGWRTYSNHKRVQELQAQMAAMFEQQRSAGDDRGRPGGEGGRERFMAIREQVDSLPESSKQEFQNGMREMFMKRMEKRMDDFLAMNKEERRKELDKRIKEDERRRKEREARRKERDAQRPQSGNGPGGSPAQTSGGPGSGGAGSGGLGSGGLGSGGGGGFGGGGRGLPGRLDNSTPEFRAKMAEYRQQMNQRRQELGLPPSRGGPGGRF